MVDFCLFLGKIKWLYVVFTLIHLFANNLTKQIQIQSQNISSKCVKCTCACCVFIYLFVDLCPHLGEDIYSLMFARS